MGSSSHSTLNSARTAAWAAGALLLASAAALSLRAPWLALALTLGSVAAAWLASRRPADRVAPGPPVLGQRDLTDERDLDGIQQRLLYMAGLVERMVTDAVLALRTRDPELAARVIATDDAVDNEEREIDARCQGALERHAAFTAGVPLLTRAMKMVTDLERIADLAVSIARRVERLAERPNTPADEFLPGLASAVQTMVSDAVDAFVRRDAALARAVIAQDDVVDVRFHAYRRATVSWMEAESGRAEIGLELQNVGKHFERMADHATNLGEHVIFLVDGADVRHLRAPIRPPPPA